MRVIPAVIIGLAFCLIATFCLLVIFNVKGKNGKNIFINLHWRRCTNLNESNIKEQKYVQKIYGIEGLVASILVFGGFMCLVFEQVIATWSLFGIAIIFVIIYELVLLKCKKFQECKYEISDEKRLLEYCENLKKLNLSQQVNLKEENAQEEEL